MKTEHFQIDILPDRLTVSNRKKSSVNMICAGLFGLTLFGGFPLFDIFAYHALLGPIAVLVLGSLFYLPCFWTGLAGLFPRALIFDRLKNHVILDDRILCDLMDLRKVEVNRYYFRAVKARPQMLQLRVLTAGGSRFIVKEGVVYSQAEMEAIGQALADFAHVDFVSLYEKPDSCG